MTHTPTGERAVRSASGEAAGTLRREAAVLRRARHPGVIELVDTFDDGEQVTLVTGPIEGVPLTGVTLSPEELAGFLAVLATTVADLHDIGITHGAIDADHVVVGYDGRPVLVGFEKARVVQGPARGWPASPAAAADVDALSELAEELLGPVVTLAGRRPAVTAMRQRLTPGLRPRDALTVVVTQARGNRRRISARVFADSLLSAVPGARLPGCCGAQEPGPDEQWRDHPAPLTTRRSKTVRIASGAACLILSTIAAVAVAPEVTAHLSPGRPHAAPVPAAAGPVPAHTPPSLATPAPIVQPSLATVPDSAPPPAPVNYADGVLGMADQRFRVGQQGDLLAVGRWSCDDTETLALARPRTSQVWVFSAWPTGPTPVIATEVGVVSGATGLHPRRVGPCDELVIDRSAGPPAVLLQRPRQ